MTSCTCTERIAIVPELPGQHEVGEGDCLATMAEQSGHFWQTLWDLPENASLREKRQNPNVLLPGDIVTIPPLRSKVEACATGQRHVFRRKGVPAFLRLRFTRRGKALVGLFYRLDIEGQSRSGQLDDDGRLSIAIPPNAYRGTLYLGEPPFEREIPLQLGQLAPITETHGVKMRLHNLGFHCGAQDDAASASLSNALHAFQQSVALPPTGELDDTTRQRLLDVHGS